MLPQSQILIETAGRQDSPRPWPKGNSVKEFRSKVKGQGLQRVQLTGGSRKVIPGAQAGCDWTHLFPVGPIGFKRPEGEADIPKGVDIRRLGVFPWVSGRLKGSLPGVAPEAGRILRMFDPETRSCACEL